MKGKPESSLEYHLRVRLTTERFLPFRLGLLDLSRFWKGDMLWIDDIWLGARQTPGNAKGWREGDMTGDLNFVVFFSE